MKDTGIVRRIDELGRVVLPKELRTTLELKEKDGVRIFVDKGAIVLKPHRTACFACGEEETSELVEVNECTICRSCARQAVEKLG